MVHQRNLAVSPALSPACMEHKVHQKIIGRAGDQTIEAQVT
eukprot:CAMPEP_0185738928 /NCGR_PEP_ID=MMETSP1171-20130828/34188_1 /TAXON_ID=374046 /ORGANISM="Helicotheca tamensis, Strain CCMP826" /LENGTH=40 /DNA_ID= /DNA_START= /DNA_END= /DNA_ORIENTATION=